MHRMARRQRERARIVADDRESRRARRAAPAPRPRSSSRARPRRDDQRPLGLARSSPRAARSPPDRDAAPPRPAAARSPAPRRARPTAARAAAPDRPARAARHRDFMRARHHVGDLLGHAQLVVPFDDLAHHAGLVEHLLAPVDLARARAELALLGDRRAAGREDQRHAVAREIDQIVDRVAGADIDVDHHGLRPAGHRVGAMRHRDREVLVRHQHRARQLGVAGRARARTPRRSAENPCPDWRRRNRRRARRARGETPPRRSVCVRSCPARSF